MADNLKISDFVTKFDKGFVHPNLFQVTFSGPNMQKIAKGSTQFLGIACKTAKIPGVTYTEGKFSVDAKYRKFVTGADLDPAEFSFLVDAGKEIMNVFDNWATEIFDMKKGTFGFKNDYICDIQVDILDRAGNSIYTGVLKNAYPTVITAFDLGFENSDQIMEYAITFNYDEIA